jgi:hypothetical protein
MIVASDVFGIVEIYEGEVANLEVNGEDGDCQGRIKPPLEAAAWLAKRRVCRGFQGYGSNPGRTSGSFSHLPVILPTVLLGTWAFGMQV